MNVVIIDSGVSTDVVSNIYKGISIVKGDNGFGVLDSFQDEVGHGTAVTQLFLNNICNKVEINLYIVKVISNSLYGYDIDSLLYALDYIDNNYLCELLIICSGIRTYNNSLSCKLEYLHHKGILIFAAFDNLGSMSYPAAFDSVVGVDISDEFNFYNKEFIGFINNPINIITKNRPYRVKWINDRLNIVKGASFACADIAGKFANYYLEHKIENVKNSYFSFLEENAIFLNNYEKKTKQENPLNNCKRAVAFPFNKEMHAIALNEDLLVLDIVDYYDIRQSGKVNIKIENILQFSNSKKVIKNIDELDWESDFDTFILGHCDKIKRLLSYDLKKSIIEKCIKYNKFLVSLDSLENYKLTDCKLYYPYVDENEISCYNNGKMYISSTPILGIFGTSSQQGKYTIQLMLRRLFVKDGYEVGQIGTEPTAALFGMDYVYPMGYNSAVYTKSNDNLVILNQYIHGCEEKSPDIIIVGSQSGTCPYNIFNLKLFTLPQIEFLLGTQPDIVVVCVNIGDDIDYVRRTVKTIEGVVCCKVIAFVVFPRKMAGKIEMISTAIISEDYQKYKLLLENMFEIPVFSMEQVELEGLYKFIIDYLS